jgi:hypothetical protein
MRIVIIFIFILNINSNAQTLKKRITLDFSREYLHFTSASSRMKTNHLGLKSYNTLIGFSFINHESFFKNKEIRYFNYSYRGGFSTIIGSQKMINKQSEYYRLPILYFNNSIEISPSMPIFKQFLFNVNANLLLNRFMFGNALVSHKLNRVYFGSRIGLVIPKSNDKLKIFYSHDLSSFFKIVPKDLDNRNLYTRRGISLDYCF